MDTHKFIFKDLEINHTIKRSLKHSYISVDTASNILLKTPKVSHTYIQSLLQEKEPWIRKQLLKLQQTPPISIKLTEEILFFATLHKIDTQEFSSLRDSLSRLRKPTKTNILRCYNDFYKDYASFYLTKRVQHYAKVMHLNYTELKFKKMRSRWGSCNSKKIITLNTQLLTLTKEQIDYVVVHELAHLKHMNHSKSFHALVQNYIKNAQEIRKEIRLRQNYI